MSYILNCLAHKEHGRGDTGIWLLYLMAALCNTPCIFLSVGMIQSVNLITEEDTGIWLLYLMAALCNAPCIFLSVGMIQSVNLITEEDETFNSRLKSAEHLDSGSTSDWKRKRTLSLWKRMLHDCLSYSALQSTQAMQIMGWYEVVKLWNVLPTRCYSESVLQGLRLKDSCCPGDDIKCVEQRCSLEHKVFSMFSWWFSHDKALLWRTCVLKSQEES